MELNGIILLKVFVHYVFKSINHREAGQRFSLMFICSGTNTNSELTSSYVQAFVCFYYECFLMGFTAMFSPCFSHFLYEAHMTLAWQMPWQHMLYLDYPLLWCLPWYLMAMPVDVPVASVVSSVKRCLDVLSRPSLGRYSTSYESYRAAASMLLPFLISNLKEWRTQNNLARLLLQM